MRITLFNKEIRITKNTIKQILINKYSISIAIFAAWIYFFDQNSIWERHENEAVIREFQKEKDYFLKNIENNKKKIHELKTNRKNLEKFAREQYLMKKKNEDIFIIIEED
jgi:cell division protein FtsB